MEIKMITQEEWNNILDAMHYVRKAYNDPKKSDEERLKEMEMYLGAGVRLCSRH